MLSDQLRQNENVILILYVHIASRFNRCHLAHNILALHKCDAFAIAFTLHKFAKQVKEI